MNHSDVVRAYNNCHSLEKVAYKFHISEAKVKKILITEGAYENETSRKIGELYKSGKSTREIAEILEIGKSCVNMYLPYKKGTYGSGTPTINALRLRKYRENRIKKSKVID